MLSPQRFAETYARVGQSHPKSRNCKAGRTGDPGGTGYKTVREITVCPACMARHAVANATRAALTDLFAAYGAKVTIAARNHRAGALAAQCCTG
jgi:hypothetical protein